MSGTDEGGADATRDLSLDVDTFSVKHSITEGAIHLVCAGECDLTALLPFDQVLKAAHAAAVEMKGDGIVLDLRAVTFMNSSCLTKMIAWIGRIRDLAPEAQYRVRIRSNAKMSWQRRSLNALQCFAVDLITIEV